MAMSPPQERVRVSVSYRHVMSPFREETMPVGVTAMDIEDASVKAGSAINNQKGSSGIQAKLDEFRDFVSRTCCSCVSRMPAILLVLAICLAIVLLFALIPAIFILTNAVQSEVPQALVSSKIEEINAIRTIPRLVADNETDEEVPMVLGIPITSLYPPNISMSYGFGFICYKDPSIVVSTSKRCDGFTDCPDGSDEQGCKSCQSWASCELENDYLACLHGGHICDNIKHCKNGFDEKEYCQSTCDNDQHKCKKANGIDICLPRMAVCDGRRDCADNSDEEQCSECAGGAKFCAVKNTCIPAQNVCNGVPDCDDYSDEKGCDLRSCNGIGKALCKADGMCIEERNICDGYEDCSDGADEVNCPGYCKLESNEPDEIDGSGSQFCCKRDNTCHNASIRCDGKADCSDGEDEIDCTCKECMGRHANISLYMCGNSSRCLRREEACSPYTNCPNATFADKAFCAIQHLRSLERYDSVTMPPV